MNARLLVLLILSGVCAQAGLIGTYEINAYFNTAGCISDVGGGYRNPYYCATGPAPGPHFLDLAPGQYSVVVTGVGPAGPDNTFVWDGTAAGGTAFDLFPRTIGRTVNINHTAGSIVLYSHDWYAWDNSPDEWTQVQVFSSDVPEPSSFLLLAAALAAFPIARRVRRRALQ